MATGKKFIHKVKALKSIPSVCVSGYIYETNDLKRLFPYIDFTNKEYFEEIFTDNKFNIGDRVRFIGKHTWEYVEISSNSIYKITKIIPQIKNDLLYMKYEIVDSNDSYIVNEEDIAEAPSKWIISFSQYKNTEMPGVHELDYAAWNRKVVNSWKSWFVFDTQDEAIAMARLFKKYTAKDIMNIIDKFENKIL